MLQLGFDYLSLGIVLPVMVLALVHGGKEEEME